MILNLDRHVLECFIYLINHIKTPQTKLEVKFKTTDRHLEYITQDKIESFITGVAEFPGKIRLLDLNEDCINRVLQLTKNCEATTALLKCIGEGQRNFPVVTEFYQRR